MSAARTKGPDGAGRGMRSIAVITGGRKGYCESGGRFGSSTRVRNTTSLMFELTYRISPNIFDRGTTPNDPWASVAASVSSPSYPWYGIHRRLPGLLVGPLALSVLPLGVGIPWLRRGEDWIVWGRFVACVEAGLCCVEVCIVVLTEVRDGI